ncbi:hypothetical protein EXIGLDRAFT_272660 [Exidia glandulosa HHB12029]|uniref:Uncharacterized protein n=1 Tax=Exidia glandulosa HHB12029 TaxID=1314781 RepID=A0A165DLJ8_EXIGL|nr:hypothetical protein EXIGLDRAFT_272660 [Exidia glandulosa HHB12029]
MQENYSTYAPWSPSGHRGVLARNKRKIDFQAAQPRLRLHVGLCRGKMRHGHDDYAPCAQPAGLDFIWCLSRRSAAAHGRSSRLSHSLTLAPALSRPRDVFRCRRGSPLCNDLTANLVPSAFYIASGSACRDTQSRPARAHAFTLGRHRRSVSDARGQLGHVIARTVTRRRRSVLRRPHPRVMSPHPPLAMDYKTCSRFLTRAVSLHSDPTP